MKAITTFSIYSRKIFLALFLLIFVPLKSSAQSETYLESFNIYNADFKVYVRTVIAAGRICSGIEIFRSEDGNVFYEIGEIPGDCGSILEPTPYLFIDESPVMNKVTYYKVHLGGYGYSDILEVLVTDTRVSGFQIRPNPTSGPTVLFFNNPSNMVHTLKLHSNSGTIITIKSTTSNSVELDLTQLAAGIYHFTINEELTGRTLSGRIFKN